MDGFTPLEVMYRTFIVLNAKDVEDLCEFKWFQRHLSWFR